MAYSAEVKKEMIERMKKEKIANISKETGISQATLYNWRKEKNAEKVQLKEQQVQINNKRYYNKQKEDFDFRQGLVFFKQRNYQKAKEYFIKSINSNGTDYNKSILFLGKIYVKIKKIKEARKEFEKYIEIDKDRNPHARLELGKLDVLEGKYEYLSKIRKKLYLETIKQADIEEIKGKILVMKGEEKKKYYLSLVAIYEKIGQRKNALQVIKEMEEEGIIVKKVGEIKNRLRSKKVIFLI